MAKLTISCPSKLGFCLKVFEVVMEGRSLKPVGGSTGSIHSIGHAWGATGEHSNAGQEDILFLEVVEKLVEVRTAKMSDSS